MEKIIAFMGSHPLVVAIIALVVIEAVVWVMVDLICRNNDY